MRDWEIYRASALSQRFREEDAEEIAQEICMRRHCGLTPATQRTEQTWVDVIRFLFGREDNPGHALRIARDLNWVQEKALLERTMQATQEKWVESQSFHHLVSPLKGVDRAILILSFVWGFDRNEIANLFGLKRSTVVTRIGQILRKRRKELSEGGADGMNEMLVNRANEP